MPHSVFGWSYPPGCSGPPEDPPERSCGACQHSEIDHDVVDEVTGELGKCLNEGCDCEKFVVPTPEPEPPYVPEDYDLDQKQAYEAELAEAEATANELNSDVCSPCRNSSAAQDGES